MYQIPELSHKGINRQKITEPRLFFCIYFWDKTNAFKYAAQTWKRDIQFQQAFDSSKDRFYEKEVFTEWDFKMAWDEVSSIAKMGNYVVWTGHLLTHSSKQSDGNDGLEFNKTSVIAFGGGEDGTFKANEIIALPKLPWHRHGFLILAGCRSGLDRAGWNPAKLFATYQKVTTLGQKGKAYFSKNWDSYARNWDSYTGKTTQTDICLWAYRRSENDWAGGGDRLLGNVFNG